MLKFIVKTINVSTRFIVGDLNPDLVARTHALDAVASTRHDLKKAKAYDVKADAKLLQELDIIMGRQGYTATELTLEQGLALADEADVEETPDNTSYQDDVYVPTAEELDGSIEDALLEFAKSYENYENVKKSAKSSTKKQRLEKMAKTLESKAIAVLDSMQYASQFEYENTASIKEKLASVEGMNVVAAVQHILPNT